MIHLTDLDNNVVNCFAQGLVTTSKSTSPSFNPHFIPRQFLPLMSLTQCPDALVDHCPSQQCPEAGNKLPASNSCCSIGRTPSSTFHHHFPSCHQLNILSMGSVCPTPTPKGLEQKEVVKPSCCSSAIILSSPLHSRHDLQIESW